MTSADVASDYLDEGGGKCFPEAACFYGSLDSLCTLVKCFEPEDWKRPGPTIKLYRLD